MRIFIPLELRIFVNCTYNWSFGLFIRFFELQEDRCPREL